jgi:hypothetical protein
MDGRGLSIRRVHRVRLRDTVYRSPAHEGPRCLCRCLEPSRRSRSPILAGTWISGETRPIARWISANCPSRTAKCCRLAHWTAKPRMSNGSRKPPATKARASSAPTTARRSSSGRGSVSPTCCSRRAPVRRFLTSGTESRAARELAAHPGVHQDAADLRAPLRTTPTGPRVARGAGRLGPVLDSACQPPGPHRRRAEASAETILGGTPSNSIPRLAYMQPAAGPGQGST